MRKWAGVSKKWPGTTAVSRSASSRLANTVVSSTPLMRGKIDRTAAWIDVLEFR